MRIILLGAPGSGKGTQAVTLSEDMGVAHISSGDLFRDEQERGTELGKLAKSFMEKGELVPDEVTIGMIKGRIKANDCEKGFILDGFPRNVSQAKALDLALATAGVEGIDKVLYIKVAEAELVYRLSGRWVCCEQQHPYHVLANPPEKKGVCDIDGSQLFQRSDDSEETARRRLSVYMDQTVPLIDYYQESGRLDEINGGDSIADVGKSMLAVLK